MTNKNETIEVMEPVLFTELSISGIRKAKVSEGQVWIDISAPTFKKKKLTPYEVLKNQIRYN